ncbi:MAG: LysM peptidoglycan-binding domain-containing protein [Clostridiales bacterium]|nr:LysM peptidoglycan-binding domain-containing protein [Clostridiales bacterium]
MKDKHSIEEEIINKMDLELLIEEYEEALKSGSKQDSVDVGFEDDIDIISRNANDLLKSKAYDTEESDTKVTDPICSYEDDTEYFDPGFLEGAEGDRYGLVYTAGMAAPPDGDGTTELSKDELLDKHAETAGEKKAKDNGRVIKMAYNLVSASIIIFLLLVTFLLVVYIQILKAGEEIASNNSNSVISGNLSANQSYVERIEEENEGLRNEIETLRNELASVSSSSGAVAEAAAEDIQDEVIPLGAPAAQDGQVAEIAEPSTQQQGQGARTYIVMRGDSLQSIANRFYGDRMMYNIIKEANNLTSDVIQPNQSLIIP